MSKWQRSLMPMYTSMGQQRMGWYGWNNEYEEVTTAVITTRIPSGNFAMTTVNCIKALPSQICHPKNSAQKYMPFLCC